MWLYVSFGLCMLSIYSKKKKLFIHKLALEQDV